MKLLDYDDRRLSDKPGYLEGGNVKDCIASISSRLVKGPLSKYLGFFMKFSKYISTINNGIFGLNKFQLEYLGVEYPISRDLLKTHKDMDVDSTALDELKQLSRSHMDRMEKDERDVLIASCTERYPGLFSIQP